MFLFSRKDSEDEDDEPPKASKHTLKTVANKVVGQQQIVGKAGQEHKILSPKRGSVGLLSVVTAITNLENTKEAVLNSDELVKKLFKGLDNSLYKPAVPSEYQSSTVPPALKNYRWGAFDLPVYHDTVLSIARPLTPPPPPATNTSVITSTTTESPQAQPEEPSPANGTPRDIETDNIPTAVSTFATSVKAAVLESQKNFPRPPRKKSHSSKSQEDNKELETNHLLVEERIEFSERPVRRRSRTDSASFGKADQPSPRSADTSIKRHSRVQLGKEQGIENSSTREERTEPEAGSIDLLEQMRALSVQDNVTQQQPSSSSARRRRQRSGNSAHKTTASRSRSHSRSKEQEGDRGQTPSAGADDSIEALLRLDSPDSQRRFLKHPGSPSAGGQGIAVDVAEELPLSAAPRTPTVTAVAEARTVSTITAAVAASPPVSPQPAQSHEVTSAQQALTSQDTADSSTPQPVGTATAGTGEESKHEGKLISPAQRSVFRPTFAAPRPQPLSPPSAVAAVAPAGISHSSNDKDTILHDASPPYRINSVNYQNIAASPPAIHNGYAEKRSLNAYETPGNAEQDINFKKFSRRPVDHNEEKQSSKTKKHASPSKHWYMAGAYSSHSEAIEAIAHLHKLVSATSPSGAINTNEMLNEKFRLQRDLGRMQWVVECSDAHSKGIVQAYTAGKQQQQQQHMLNIHGIEEHSRYPDHHPTPASVREGKPRHNEKYLRERDQALEHNMRAIRQQLPTQQDQQQEARLRFPPIQQAQALPQQQSKHKNSKPKSSQQQPSSRHKGGRRKG